jgi:hypothetical protein
VSNWEWMAIVIGGGAGWVAVSWAIDKVRELNSRPSPLDATAAPHESGDDREVDEHAASDPSNATGRGASAHPNPLARARYPR